MNGIVQKPKQIARGPRFSYQGVRTSPGLNYSTLAETNQLIQFILSLLAPGIPRSLIGPGES